MELHRTVRQLFGWGVGLSAGFTLLYGIGGQSFLELLTNESSVIQEADTYFYWVLAIPLAGFSAFLWDVMGNHALWMAFIIYLSLRGLVQAFLAKKIVH